MPFGNRRFAIVPLVKTRAGCLSLRLKRGRVMAMPSGENGTAPLDESRGLPLGCRASMAALRRRGGRRIAITGTLIAMKKLLKRLRDNYYVSQCIAPAAKLLGSASLRAALAIERRVRKNGVTIPLPNGRNLTIGKNTSVGMASLLFWRGLDGHEPETSRTLRFFFERSQTFIDVGANCGFYSLLGALWNPTLKVIAFEPVASIFSTLRRNVVLNQVEDRILCENLALSSGSGKATLFLPESDTLDVETTGTLVRDSWQQRSGAPTIEVETIRFDDYISRHAMRVNLGVDRRVERVKVDLVKIDVEDFEADVIEGMRETILRDQPFIVCEVLPRLHGNEKTRKIVEALKYQAYWITPLGYMKVSGFQCTRRQFTDFLLSPVSTPDTLLENLDALWQLRKPAA
jgi:FkbM family methyltransferase